MCRRFVEPRGLETTNSTLEDLQKSVSACTQRLEVRDSTHRLLPVVSARGTTSSTSACNAGVGEEPSFTCCPPRLSGQARRQLPSPRNPTSSTHPPAAASSSCFLGTCKASIRSHNRRSTTFPLPLQLPPPPPRASVPRSSDSTLTPPRPPPSPRRASPNQCH